MRYLGATKKQRAYAMGVLDNHKSRRQVALQEGYSNTMADNPKQIETSTGFKIAMAQQAYQAGNLVSGMMNELEARGFKDYDTSELLKGLDTISKVFERFKPKETSNSDSDVSRIFAGIVGGETGETTGETQDNEITEQSRDTMQDLTSIIKDSIVKDIADNETSEVSNNTGDVLHNELDSMSSDTVA